MLPISQITPRNFNAEALELFRYQFRHNPVYREFCTLLRRTPDQVNEVAAIPFLPVELFKNHRIITGDYSPEETFTSSTTTGGTPSQHFVRSLTHYDQVYTLGFEREYGPLSEYTILGLLPSYLEREGSSLVRMAEGMIERSVDSRSGFYLYQHDELAALLLQLQREQKKTLLLGVTFGLLNLAEEFTQGNFGATALEFPELRVMETGGMKGRRKELIREEVHAVLKSAFPASPIDSEYGMTELLSQAYLKDSGFFVCPDWMRVYTRDIADPLASPQRNGSRGALNIIDLAGRDSCAFLAVSDSGRVFENGTFEVYGRVDHSEIRGCNLMISL
ncbi:MAG: Uncharacterised protein [Cryomorphaceae bacterium]|nr:MAG: Uncharacterised protein [Cryomorphaceae bacterium]